MYIVTCSSLTLIKKYRFNIVFCSVLIIYCSVSITLFNKVYDTSTLVVNEEYHLPQGLAYCNNDFSGWNPQIPTPPGLYCISSLILGPLKLCTTYWLRFINLIASVINLCLFYIYITSCKDNKQSSWMNLLQCLNLSLLPPLYFYSHLYYPDVMSVTCVLLLLITNKKRWHIPSAIFGLISVTINQTNIIWVVMVFTNYISCEFFKSWKPHSFNKLTVEDILTGLEIGNLIITKNLKKIASSRFRVNVLSYGLVILLFFCFVAINGGVACGNRKKYVITAHLTQCFYLSLFCVVFTWPYMLAKIQILYKKVCDNKLRHLALMFAFIIVINHNTFQHPLEDVRHIVSIFWNQIHFNKYYCHYLLIPFYYFGIWFASQEVRRNSKELYAQSFMISAWLSVIMHPLIDIRHFVLPYIIFKLNLRDNVAYQLILEFNFYCALNIYGFYLYFYKTVMLLEDEITHRLVW